MKSPRKPALALAGFALLLAPLAACSNGQPETQPTQSGEPAGEVEWVYPGTSDVERQFAEGFIQEFELEYPETQVTVNYLSWNDMQKTLAVRLQANDAPDVTITQDITSLVGMDGLADLTAVAGELDPDDFLPGTLEYSSIDGGLYSIPYQATGFTLIVNEELLADAGYEVEDLQSWEDIEAAAKAMTKGDVSGFAYPLGNPRFVFRGALTAAYSNDLVLNDVAPEAQAKWTDLLEHLKTLNEYSPAAASTWDYPDMWRAYANGKVGMVAGGTYFTANVYSINPDIIDVSRQISYPAGPESDVPMTPVSSVGYAMFKDSESQNASLALIESLTSPQNVLKQAAAVNLPARLSVDRDALYEEAEKVYPDAIDGHIRVTEDGFAAVETNGVPLAKIPGQPDMEPAFQDIMVRYLSGGITTDQALDEIATAFGAINEDYGN